MFKPAFTAARKRRWASSSLYCSLSRWGWRAMAKKIRRKFPKSIHNKRFLVQIGRVVTHWNDLEVTAKMMLFNATDALYMAAVAPRLNITTTIDVLRTIANEYDDEEGYIAKTIKYPQELGIKGRRSLAPIAPHVHHFLDYVDRLREYRNYCIHGIGSPNSQRQYSAFTMTSRWRIKLHGSGISLSQITELADEIKTCQRYGETIADAIKQNRDYVLYRANKRATWPRKPALPNKLLKEKSSSPRADTPASIRRRLIRSGGVRGRFLGLISALRFVPMAHQKCPW